MNQPRLFLLVPTHKNSQKEWNPVASSTSLFELEKLAAKLNCVNRWKVVQTMHKNTPAGAGSIILKRWPKQ